MEEKIQNINDIFKRLELQGVDTKINLLYGYFFVDENQEKLSTLKTVLTKDDYSFISIEPIDDGYFLLHIEKIEIHSRESLLKRLIQMEELAEKYQIEAFDGWDLGNSDSTKPLISNEKIKNLMKLKSNEELFDFAVELLENNIYDKSLIVFDKCISNNYQIENCLYKQFICFDYLDEPQKAISNLKKVLDLNPNHFKANFNIGAISYALEDFKTSIEYYEKSVKIDNKNDFAYYGISLSQYCIGKIQESKKNCEIALELNPENENAIELLKIIEEEK